LTDHEVIRGTDEYNEYFKGYRTLKYIKEHYNFSLYGNEVNKKLDNEIELFVLLLADGNVSVGYRNIKQNKNELINLLNDKHFNNKYFSELIIDDYNDIMYRNYFFDENDLPDVICLYNVIAYLEIKCNKL
jgi:hypothetical protein